MPLESVTPLQLIKAKSMYKVSGSNAPHFLVGKDLIQVGVGSNDIVMNFDKQCSLTIMSVEQFRKDNADMLNSVISFDGRYVGNTVKEVTVRDCNSFLLTFDNGSKTIATDDSSEFESMILKDGSRTYSI